VKLSELLKFDLDIPSDSSIYVAAAAGAFAGCFVGFAYACFFACCPDPVMAW
jgi:hypothetical protein